MHIIRSTWPLQPALVFQCKVYVAPFKSTSEPHELELTVGVLDPFIISNAMRQRQNIQFNSMHKYLIIKHQNLCISLFKYIILDYPHSDNLLVKSKHYLKKYFNLE